MEYGIRSLKGKYSGPITMVGNGPSLDLDAIGSPSMAMNSISLAFPKTEWRPDFYVCITRELTNNELLMGRVVEVLETGIPCFLNVNYYPTLGNWPNSYYISIAYHYHEPLPGDWFQNGVWFTSFATTMVPAAQIAQFLGFQRFAFVGCDGYRVHSDDKDPNHFDETYNTGLATEVQDLTSEKVVAEINRKMQLAREHIYRNLVRANNV